MAENPLIGKRISLISTKNIRYLGTLYSINEQNATVALQNVKSYGTEGRETVSPVEPSEAVHPFLLFRGQDIKDLHVHEEPEEVTSSANPEAQPPQSPVAAKAEESPAPETSSSVWDNPPRVKEESSQSQQQQNKAQKKGGRGGKRQQQQQQQQQRAAVGTGASLLNRHARGAVAPSENPKGEFDFQSNLDEFQADDDDDDDDEAGDEPPAAYEKNDFFDSISCDATDRMSGVNNRLRSKEERNLNTETFGAVALSQNRRRRGGRGGRGGRGRGRGRGGRGRGGRGNSSYRRNNSGGNTENVSS